MPKNRAEIEKVNFRILLLTDLSLAMRSDPIGLSRVYGELVTSV